MIHARKQVACYFRLRSRSVILGSPKYRYLYIILYIRLVTQEINVLIITSIILLTDIVYTLRGSHFHIFDFHLFLLIMKSPERNPRLSCPKYLLGYTIHTKVNNVQFIYFCTCFKIRFSLTSTSNTVLSSYWIFLAQIMPDFVSLCLLYVYSTSI